MRNVLLPLPAWGHDKKVEEAQEDLILLEMDKMVIRHDGTLYSSHQFLLSLTAFLSVGGQCFDFTHSSG